MKAWVLSGGGARIVQQFVLIEKHLKNGGTLPDLIVGSSAGGLLSFLISYVGIDGARKELLNIRSRRDLFTGFMLFGPRNPGFWYSRPLENLIARIKKRYLPKIEGYVCSLDMMEMKPVYFPLTASAKAIASTACIPVVVEPIDRRYADGGVQENTPLKFAIDRGADEIEVFMCSTDDFEQSLVGWKIDALVKLFEAQRIEIARGDVHVCEIKNEISGKKKINVTMHEPRENLLGILEFERMRDVYKTLSK